MKKYIVIAGAILISVLMIQIAVAQNLEDDSRIKYPIESLGGCADKKACKTYCDEPANLDACLTFAEQNNLMSGDELSKAKKFLAAGAKGPSGCTGKNSCEEYCNDINHIKECVAFAEKTGMMPPAELEEAKKVEAAIEKGIKPPACGGKKACDAYCQEPSHMEECFTFAQAAGFLSPEEAADAQKMMSAIRHGAKPPELRTRFPALRGRVETH